MNEFYKEAMQKHLEEEFPLGLPVYFYEKTPTNFRGKTKQGLVSRVKHPFIHVVCEEKEYLLYPGEIEKSL